jgi:hypothetical protein
MRRITDVKDFDRWANDDEMSAKQGYPGLKTDNSWVFDYDGINVVLEEDGCCMPFIRNAKPVGWNDFDMHFLFPADRRGARALAAARKMVAEMFTTYRARVIEGTIPRWNLAARMVVRQLGFAPVETTELGGKPAVTYALDKATWLGSAPQSAELDKSQRQAQLAEPQRKPTSVSSKGATTPSTSQA